MATQNLVRGGDAGRWEQAIYASFAENERRSGSMRTVRAYSGMLYRFFGTLGGHGDGGLWICPRHRPLRQEALLGNHRSPRRLPQFILPLPHPHEPY